MSASMAAGMIVGERWRITGLLGQGGFGQVFRCVDESNIGLGEAALKVLHPNTSPQERNDFLREVKKIARLRHQNLVGYLDSGLEPVDGEIHPYLVTELCEGSLADHLQRRPGLRLDTTEAAGVLGQISAGLAHLHGRGLIHRDIKPANVLFGDGQWKLADFGLMRDLTATGSYHRGDAVTGTPLFMAPELFTTMTATAPSDVYAAGVLAHMCLSGRPVHVGSGPALVHAITTTPPTIDPSIDPRLRHLISLAVHHDPARRITADQFHRRLVAENWALAAPASPQVASTQAPPIEPPLAATPAPTPVTRPLSSTPHGFTTAGPSVADDVRPSPPRPTDHGAPVSARKSSTVAAVLIGVSALAVLAMIVAGAAAFLLTGGSTSSDPGSGQTVESSVPVPVDDEATGQADDSGVVIGDGVEIGDGVQIGDDAPTEDGGPALAPTAVPEPESHMDVVACESGPGGQLLVTNRFDQHVDYVVEVAHLDAAEVRIDESRETVRALAPGETTSLDIESNEDGATACRLDTFEATPTVEEILINRDLAVLETCTADIAGHQMAVTLTNPSDVAVDAEVYVAVTDENGLRVDEDWAGINVFDMAPGETVRAVGRAVFWNLDSLGDPPVDCSVIAVEFDPR